jgi:hypothetical protein
MLNEGRIERVPWMKLGNRYSLSHGCCILNLCVLHNSICGNITWCHLLLMSLDPQCGVESDSAQVPRGVEPSGISLPVSLFLQQRFYSWTGSGETRWGDRVSVMEGRQVGVWVLEQELRLLQASLSRRWFYGPSRMLGCCLILGCVTGKSLRLGGQSPPHRLLQGRTGTWNTQDKCPHASEMQKLRQ